MALKDSSVVVTGLGCVSPVGQGMGDCWTALKEGRSGLDRPSFDNEDVKCQVVGEVKDFNPRDYMVPKMVRRMARVSQLATSAAVLAVADAKLDLEAEDQDRVGCIIGSGGGDNNIVAAQFKKYLEVGPKAVHPLSIPKMIPNMPTCNAAMVLGLHGPNLGVATACATGAHAIGIGMMTLRSGMADVCLAGGAESTMTRLVMAAYDNMGVFTKQNDVPSAASRPFDATRDGFVMGEGSGVLVLETWAHARARGAEPLAELAGFGMTCDAYHIAAPQPEGTFAAKAMSLAMADAGLEPGDIGYINAHGTSTELNDVIETRAIKLAMGEYGDRVPVGSTKSMTGHCLGAAGGVEACASVMAVKEGFLPPSINYNTPDPDCDLNIIGNSGRSEEIIASMSNSFGFGGQNGVLVFKKI